MASRVHFWLLLVTTSIITLVTIAASENIGRWQDAGTWLSVAVIALGAVALLTEIGIWVRGRPDVKVGFAGTAPVTSTHQIGESTTLSPSPVWPTGSTLSDPVDLTFTTFTKTRIREVGWNYFLPRELTLVPTARGGSSVDPRFNFDKVDPDGQIHAVRRVDYIPGGHTYADHITVRVPRVPGFNVLGVVSFDGGHREFSLRIAIR